MIRVMKQDLPSIDVIKGRLSGLNHAELNALAAASGAPFGTLMKIRQGGTKNPRLATVLKIMENLPRCAKQAPKAAATTQEATY